MCGAKTSRFLQRMWNKFTLRVLFVELCRRNSAELFCQGDRVYSKKKKKFLSMKEVKLNWHLNFLQLFPTKVIKQQWKNINYSIILSVFKAESHQHRNVFIYGCFSWSVFILFVPYQVYVCCINSTNFIVVFILLMIGCLLCVPTAKGISYWEDKVTWIWFDMNP